MKRIAAFLLVLVILLPMIPAKAETVAVKPYYAIGSSDFNRTKFPNLEGRLTVSVIVEDGEVYLSYSGAGRDINKIASNLKSALDDYPEGMRSIVLHNTSDVFQLQKDTIYFEEGVEKLRNVFSAFMKAYAEIGGKLDYIVLDVEYVDTYNWYLYSKQYTKNNPDVYKNIVANPLYQTTVRPLLAEHGFLFYEDASKPEIWSAYPRLKGEEAKKYADCLTIWNTVMRIRLNNYMTYAVYEPMAQYMPNVRVYDYQSRYTNAWLKDLTDKGEHNYIAGNSVPVGVTSHYNTYGSRLSDSFFAVDGQPVYNNPVAYNGAEFAATPFNRILWDVNLMKNMYQASGGNVSITVAEYDYSPDKVGTPSNTQYYTESIFHIGLLDPKPFCIYMYDKAFETTAAYNKRAKVLQEIMAELTRVAGYADREPIPVPAIWNSSFLLSGIYANGRNLWRFTPDINKVDPAKFALAGDDPVFYINGQTITFPQGEIIPDGPISVVGSYGYWIETPKDVTPIVTNDADRYSQYPSFAENFEGYAAGTAFNNANAKPLLCWQVTGNTPVVEKGSLAFTGTATVTNEKLPQNITAGDYYAKQQAWEISVTLPQNMNGELKLLACGDGGIKIAGGRAYYDANGTYKELAQLSAGQKYTLKREVDFRSDFQCDYTVYDSAGKVIGQAKAVPMAKISLPVTKISMSCTNVTGNVLVDDYKLYPTGVTADFECYNAKTGMQIDGVKSSENVAYRLSWLNGSKNTENMEVVATFYDADSKLVSQKIIQKVEMNPGCDSVETGIMEVPQGQMVTLTLRKEKPATKPTTVPTQKPTTAPTVAQTAKPTAVPTVTPTGGQTAKPTQGQVVRPTNQLIGKPPVAQTTKPATATTIAPTKEANTLPSGVPPTESEVMPIETQNEKPTIEPSQALPDTGPTTELPQTPTNTETATEPSRVPVATKPSQAPTQGTEVSKITEATKPNEDDDEADVEVDNDPNIVLTVSIAVMVLGGAGSAAFILYNKKKKQ